MKRAEWQKLAEERARDAETLLDGARWAAAYYLAGYAVECGLKSCVVAYVEAIPDIVFRDKSYSDKCWTHDITKLVALADLEKIRDANTLTNPALSNNWRLVQRWSEKSRYDWNLESDARTLYEAVTHHANGVLPWIRTHW